MSAKIDLTGQIFGRLTVLRDSGKREGSNVIWTCSCSCGRPHDTTGKRLRKRKTRSCGCLRKEVLRALKTKDLTGQVIEYSVVLRDSGKRRGGTHKNNGSVLWECICMGGSDYGFPACKGSFLATRGDFFDRGQVSCGCYRTHLARNRFIDIAGQEFGYLTAIRPTKKRSGHDVVWKFRCDSPYHKKPKYKDISGILVRRGHTISCGCWFTEQASLRALESMEEGHKKPYPFQRSNGCVTWMRSSLEVGWALYLEESDLEWQYEPRVFMLTNGKRYVPDFYIPSKDTWHEIKHSEDGRADESLEKQKEFSKTHNCKIITESQIEKALGMKYRQILDLAKEIRDEYNATIGD